MPETVSSKKRYFKKEKKELKHRRHKAKSAAQLKAAEKKGLRREIQVEQNNKIKSLTGSSKRITLPKLQFPNISRFITESFEKITLGSFIGLARVWIENFPKRPIRHAQRKNFWMSILLIGSLIFALFLGWKLWTVYAAWQNAKEEYTQLQQQLTTWEGITKEYPTYRDAYFEAAVLAYRLGEKDKEEAYLQKTLAIDPNFEPARQLQNTSRN